MRMYHSTMSRLPPYKGPKLRRGEYYAYDPEAAVAVEQVLPNGLIQRGRGIIADEILSTEARKYFFVEDQVLDDNTYALRRTMRVASSLVTIPAFLTFAMLVPAALVVGAASIGLLRESAVTSTLAKLGIALAAGMVCAVSFAAARVYSEEDTKELYHKPHMGSPDFATVNRANAEQNSDILNNELETIFECEPDNIWFKALALKRSNLTTQKKYLKAVVTGLQTGFRHNAFTSFFTKRSLEKNEHIAFRLKDAATRQAPLWEPAGPFASQRPRSFLAQPWINAKL